MRASLAVVTLLLPAALAAPAAASAAPAPARAPVTCQGVKATIVGTPGDNVLSGTKGRDVIAGLGGDDVLRGLGGSDLLCGGSGADRLYGGADRRWHDQFQTIATGDRLDGGAGDDLLNPGPTIKGVALVQPDLLVFASADGVTVDLGAKKATGQGHDKIVWRRTLGVVGSPGDDHLVGTDERDHLRGEAGDDVLEGLGGADVLVANDGDDSVLGGDGKDDITSRGGRDAIDAGPAQDVISVHGGGADDIDAGEGGDLLFLWVGVAGAFDGTVLDSGPAGPQEWNTDNLYLSKIGPLQGAKFAIDLLAGTITRDGHAGTVTGFGYVDFSVPGARLVFRGSDGPEELLVEGNSRVDAHGRGGDDVLYGGPRNDRLIGGDGDDFVSGSGGDDICDAEQMRGCEVMRP